MAKKAETPEAPATTTTKADAVRAAVAAGVLKPQDACYWIKEKYGIEITPAHFSSYKSSHAKLAGTSGAGKRRGRPPAEATASAPPVATPEGRRVGNGRHAATGGAVALATQLKGLITEYGADEVTGMLGVLKN